MNVIKSRIAAYDVYDNEAPSAGIVTGIGIVHDKEVVIIANDATACNKATKKIEKEKT